MSLLDQVITEVKNNNILKDEIPIISPSLNPSDKTNYPDSWEKVSKKEYQEETDFSQKLDFSVDLKKDNELIDNSILAEINKEFRDKDSGTDVISFAYHEDRCDFAPYTTLGDIIISLERVI